MPDATFGTELRRLRSAAGFSLTDLADAVHYSKGYLSKVENGQAQANSTLAALCEDVLDAKGTLLTMVPSRRRRPGRPRGVGPRHAGLPADAAHFTGRTDRLAELRAALVDDGPDAPAVSVLAGMAGVGKTALAVRVAHQVEEWFADGSLFLDLHGYTPGSTGMSSADALDRLLRQLGVPGEQIPADLDDRATYYRGLLRPLRLLVVLDNATSAAQLRPLLPGERACRVLVTSRGRLPALDDARHFSLDALSQAEAVTLFAAVAGPERGGLDVELVREVVGVCGYLPLAVRVAAARYRANPGWSLVDLRDRLAQPLDLRNELDDGERSVFAAFQLSYRELPAESRRLFALLSLHPGADLDGHVAAALGDLDLAEARRIVDRLHESYLLTQRPAERYAFHDLLKAFATDAASRDLPAGQRAVAMHRLIGYGLHCAHTADLLLTPHRYRPDVPIDRPRAPRIFADPAQARGWMQAQWPMLVQLCHIAAAAGQHARCWQLAFALRGYFFLAKLWDPWIDTHELALRSARASGDRWAEAVTLDNLGVAHVDRGELAEASACYERALVLFEEIGNEQGRVTALANLGWAHHYQGEHEQARGELSAALRAYERAGSERNAAITLRGIALAETELGHSADAVRHTTEALAVFDRLGLEFDAAMAFNCLGWAHFRAGEHDQAAQAYRQAVVRAERIGSDHEIARAETGLGNVAAAQDRLDEAVRYWDRAEQRCPELNATVIGERRMRRDIG